MRQILIDALGLPSSKPLPAPAVQATLSLTPLAMALSGICRASIDTGPHRATHLLYVPGSEPVGRRTTKRPPAEQKLAHEAAAVRRAAREQRNLLRAGKSGEGAL